MTREELYEIAQERDIDGRSQMSKEELAAALELEDTGPDAVALLERQHARIRELFQEYEQLSGRPSKRKQELVGQIITDLVKHAQVEEQVLYPAVQKEIDGAGDEIDESLEEHHAAELLMAELDLMTPDRERYDAKVTVLMENVQHHIEEEEQELFPKLRAQWNEERRRELGAAMVKVWKVAPMRPSPMSPSQPPAAALIAIPKALWDIAVNLTRLARIKVFNR
jgi:hemerythrin superfamily protein